MVEVFLPTHSSVCSFFCCFWPDESAEQLNWPKWPIMAILAGLDNSPATVPEHMCALWSVTHLISKGKVDGKAMMIDLNEQQMQPAETACNKLQEPICVNHHQIRHQWKSQSSLTVPHWKTFIHNKQSLLGKGEEEISGNLLQFIKLSFNRFKISYV